MYEISPACNVIQLNIRIKDKVLMYDGSNIYVCVKFAFP